MASLELEFTINHDGITLTFSGFNDSLTTFVTETLKLIDGFAKVPGEDLREIFNQIKEKLIQEWHNFYYEQSYR